MLLFLKFIFKCNVHKDTWPHLFASYRNMFALFLLQCGRVAFLSFFQNSVSNVHKDTWPHSLGGYSNTFAFVLLQCGPLFSLRCWSFRPSVMRALVIYKFDQSCFLNIISMLYESWKQKINRYKHYDFTLNILSTYLTQTVQTFIFCQFFTCYTNN